MKAAKSTQATQIAVVAEKPAAVLLNAEQLAERLNVPVSWIREKSRERAQLRDGDNALPVVVLGKYRRFSWDAVQEWLKRQIR